MYRPIVFGAIVLAGLSCMAFVVCIFAITLAVGGSSSSIGSSSSVDDDFGDDDFGDCEFENTSSLESMISWARQPNSTGPDRITGISISLDGSIYVTGLYLGGFGFGVQLPYSSGYTIWVARFTKLGKLIWQRSIDTNSELGFPPKIQSDLSGVYIYGSFRGNVTIPTSSTIELSSSLTNSFVGKLNLAGRWIWCWPYPGGKNSIITTIADMKLYNTTGATEQKLMVAIRSRTKSFKVGNVTYANANFHLRGYLVSLSIEGVPEWSMNIGPSFDDYFIQAVTIYGDDIWATGMFYNTVSFGTSVLITKSRADLFVAGATVSSKKWKWAISVVNNATQFQGNSMISDESGAYLTGLYDGNAGFVSYGGVTYNTLTSYGNNDIFVAHIDNNGTWKFTTSYGGPFNDYASVITFSISGFYLVGSLRENDGVEQWYLASLSKTGIWETVSTLKPMGDNLADEIMAMDYSSMAKGGASLIVGGFFHGNYTIGMANYVSTQYQNSLLAKINPAKIRC